MFVFLSLRKYVKKNISEMSLPLFLFCLHLLCSLCTFRTMHEYRPSIEVIQFNREHISFGMIFFLQFLHWNQDSLVSIVIMLRHSRA